MGDYREKYENKCLKGMAKADKNLAKNNLTILLDMVKFFKNIFDRTKH